MTYASTPSVTRLTIGFHGIKSLNQPFARKVTADDSRNPGHEGPDVEERMARPRILFVESYPGVIIDSFFCLDWTVLFADTVDF
jgi:hypothetical protein